MDKREHSERWLGRFDYREAGPQWMGAAAAKGILVIFDRTADRCREDKVSRREERCGEPRVVVGGM